MTLTTQAMALGLEEKEYRELLQLFVETGQLDIDRLKVAYGDGDIRQMARIAHTITGSAGNLGLMEISALARRIELASNTGRLESVRLGLAEIQPALDEIACVSGIHCAAGSSS